MQSLSIGLDGEPLQQLLAFIDWILICRTITIHQKLSFVGLFIRHFIKI